ncbi:hypothetical protein IJ118_01145 [Candidatus Saccharibacteria bacterium]|nr:hypothetical protein [Candidatus Saccharibacteria bacterium]
MSGARNKVRQLKYRLKHDFLTPENVVLAVAVAMCLTWTYQSIEAMNRNWMLTERLNMERKNLQLLEVEVETAELTNEYLKSEEYQELAARKLAGKQLAGEHMVYLPENSEAAKKKHEVVAEVTEETTAPEYSNFEKWIMYLFPNR